MGEDQQLPSPLSQNEIVTGLAFLSLFILLPVKVHAHALNPFAPSPASIVFRVDSHPCGALSDYGTKLLL